MDVQKKLRELGVKPVKGQNFLNSEAVVHALVEAGEVEEKTALEIGPGTGVITEILEEKASKVYAVEKDTRLAEHLRESFSNSEVEIVNEDILEYGWPEVDRCVSNLPFQVTSKVIQMLGEKQVQSALILQKELAEKAVEDPGDKNYGRFTVMVNYYFLPVKLRDVSSRNFYPEPEVDTSILKLYPNRDRHGIEDEEFFFETVRALFTHKRKKTRNAFVDSRHILEITKNEAKQIRDELPHSEERVINLGVKQIADIADFLEDKL